MTGRALGYEPQGVPSLSWSSWQAQSVRGRQWLTKGETEQNRNTQFSLCAPWRNVRVCLEIIVGPQLVETYLTSCTTQRYIVVFTFTWQLSVSSAWWKQSTLSHTTSLWYTFNIILLSAPQFSAIFFSKTLPPNIVRGFPLLMCAVLSISFSQTVPDESNKDRPTWCHLLYYFTI